MMLNLMLRELGILEAEYPLEAHEEEAWFVSPCFKKIMYQPCRDRLRTWQYLESSTQVMKLLKCVQKVTNTVIKDFNYTRLQNQNKALQQQLGDSDDNKKSLAGWYLVVRHVFIFCIDEKHNASLTYLSEKVQWQGYKYTSMLRKWLTSLKLGAHAWRNVWKIGQVPKL